VTPFDVGKGLTVAAAVTECMGQHPLLVNYHGACHCRAWGGGCTTSAHRVGACGRQLRSNGAHWTACRLCICVVAHRGMSAVHPSSPTTRQSLPPIAYLPRMAGQQGIAWWLHSHAPPSCAATEHQACSLVRWPHRSPPHTAAAACASTSPQPCCVLLLLQVR
jgi:hypothetical protein